MLAQPDHVSAIHAAAAAIPSRAVFLSSFDETIKASMLGNHGLSPPFSLLLCTL